MTIKDAIKEVMRRKGAPMTAQEAYDAIIEAGLYEFNAAIPSAIVRGELRKHCVGVEFSTASKTKHFELIGSNKYYFLDKAITVNSTAKQAITSKNIPSGLGISEVKLAQLKHRQQFTNSIIKQIQKIKPENFEHFTKNLLEAYGFEDVEVTSYSKDAGIDGFGRLKVGLGIITVAFQCKRYTSKSVRTKEIQEFRGSIQGKCEQGLFFTTSKFTKDCEVLMFQAGAVPIIMIDGEGIVEIMIEKRFGVEVESVPVFINALDLALVDD